MRLALVLLAAAVASPAVADPVDEARSATAACLAAVIDKAPVSTIEGDQVGIRRDGGLGPCTVEVRSGAPEEVRAAVLAAIAAREEAFRPALTRWEPGAYAAVETFCNAPPARRALNVVVSTARAGAEGPVLGVTVLEPAERDPRCDADLGPQPSPG